MPEGPSIVILKELVAPFTGQRVEAVGGNTKVEKDRAAGQTVRAFRSWGKHFLVVFDDFAFRIHFLLFGSYRINERKETPARLSLTFANGELNFYACSVKVLEGDLDALYDWRADVMADAWDAKAARKKLRTHPDMLACDAILDQDIFAGAGNIIKNEVLYRLKVHPASTMGALPPRKLNGLVDEVRNYSFDFLRWKKAYELKKHWLAHTKTMCTRCGLPLIKRHLGKTNRRTFYCEGCQVKYE